MPDYPSQFEGSSFIARSSPISGAALPPPLSEVPPANWYTQPIPFDWTSVWSDGTGIWPIGWVYSWEWKSPVFDLRPDLIAANGGTKEGMSMWSRGARLYVSVFQNVDPAVPLRQPYVITTNLVVRAVDWVNTTFNMASVRGSPPDSAGTQQGGSLMRDATRNVSALFNNPFYRTVVLSGFAPPGTYLGFGEGHPIRYWRLHLVFTQFVETGLPQPDPDAVDIPLVLQAAAY